MDVTPSDKACEHRSHTTQNVTNYYYKLTDSESSTSFLMTVKWMHSINIKSNILKMVHRFSDLEQVVTKLYYTC